MNVRVPKTLSRASLRQAFRPSSLVLETSTDKRSFRYLGLDVSPKAEPRRSVRLNGASRSARDLRRHLYQEFESHADRSVHRPFREIGNTSAKRIRLRPEWRFPLQMHWDSSRASNGRKLLSSQQTSVQTKPTLTVRILYRRDLQIQLGRFLA